MSIDLSLSAQLETIEHLQPLRIIGRVAALRGLVLIAHDLPLPAGSLVEIPRRVGRHDIRVFGEIVGFDGPRAIVMLLNAPAGAAGVRCGDPIIGLHATQMIGVSDAMLGRVIDGLGRPIDGGGPIHATTPRPLDPAPLSPMARRRIRQPLYTGVRAVDLFTTLGCGQRLGVFAGPGVGKSTLLGAIAKQTSADVSVVALIGERGREVRDFIEHNLGEQGLKRCVVVAATSDESPLMRVRAALAACSIAEHFRDEGRDVLLIMDSVTRFAHAQRQIGLSVGEPPATRGYTPSVFATLARLLERAGASGAGGSITGLYSILVEGDDMTEPIADASRGILDGHVMLSRTLAQRGHFPAIDILDSVSRVADDVTDAAHAAARRQVVRMLAAYKQVEDLVQIGAYARGSNPESDAAIRFHPQIIDLLQQQLRTPDTGGFAAARDRLLKLAIEIGAALPRPQAAAQPASPSSAAAAPSRAAATPANPPKKA
jgi:flagellum-specific ATP synthase